MYEFTVLTWRPGSEMADDSTDQLATRELPEGTYEVDIQVPPGLPNLVWDKSITIDQSGRDVTLRSFKVTTVKVRKFLPDGKVGTLRLKVGPRMRGGTGDSVQAIFTVGGALLLFGGVIGVGTIATMLIVEVRKTIEIAPEALKEPAVKLVAGAGLLFAASMVIKSTRGGG